MQTSTVPVTLRLGAAAAPALTSPYRFVVPARDSPFVLEAEVSPADLAAARARWRAMTWAVVLSVLAVALLLCMGPAIDLRRRTRDISRFLIMTAVLVMIVVAVRFILYAALKPIAPSAQPTPFDLLFTTLTMAGVVWLVLDVIEGRRFAEPLLRMLAPSVSATVGCSGATSGSSAASSPTRTSICCIFRFTR